MRINNVSAKTSKMVVVLLAIFAIIVTVGFSWAYFNTAISEHSIASFFKWYAETLNHLIADNRDEPITPYLIMIIIPLLAYGGLVASIVSRHFALKAMESTLNLKSVDFLQDRVKFNFNRPQYNFICGYNDINNLDHFNVSPSAVGGKSRKRDFVVARQVSMYLAQKYTKMPASRIGKLVGNRDHSTVIHSCTQVENRLKVDKEFLAEIQSLENSFKIKA